MSDNKPNLHRVLRFSDTKPSELDELLSRFGLVIYVHTDEEAIAGSFWGEEEAGLIGNWLYLRSDTPVHSILHEACHFICMDEVRRSRLHTDAQGNNAEESAVCYLQILLAQTLPSMGYERILADMDAWGYSFRLGSTQDWFLNDAEDAIEWLIQHQLIDRQHRCLFQLARHPAYSAQEIAQSG